MPKRKSKAPRLPDSFQCANPACGRWLTVKYYILHHQPKDKPPEEVHRLFRPDLPPFTLGCTCGHHTVVSPWEHS